MAIREVYQKDEPLLRKVSKPVKEITPRIRDLIQDLKDTMELENGVGIASPQVGVLRRIFIILDENGNKKTYINPEIISKYGADIMMEGCLSVKGAEPGYVIRPDFIHIKAQDENFEVFEEELSEFICREFCHEFDHLEGILYTDKLIPQSDIEKVYYYLLDKCIKDKPEINIIDEENHEEIMNGPVDIDILNEMLIIFADDYLSDDDEPISERNFEDEDELLSLLIKILNECK